MYLYVSHVLTAGSCGAVARPSLVHRVHDCAVLWQHDGEWVYYRSTCTAHIAQRPSSTAVYVDTLTCLRRLCTRSTRTTTSRTGILQRACGHMRSGEFVFVGMMLWVVLACACRLLPCSHTHMLDSLASDTVACMLHSGTCPAAGPDRVLATQPASSQPATS